MLCKSCDSELKELLFSAYCPVCEDKTDPKIEINQGLLWDEYLNKNGDYHEQD